ncbi:TauD/TfdA family dioxygenase [Streptomyces sp. LBL]|uniref:TauD/TfdA family dioxygenase n=1 Tax=Streptomyces sp. LBL TaxID=2940562 RepID=UPI0024760153|nr:TauD/TfdA family dioxygenase [Streptomyces sp. LBL]
MDAETVGGIERLWSTLGLSDTALKDPQRQKAWRHRLYDTVGEPWEQVVRQVREGLDTEPHAAVITSHPPRQASVPLLAALSAALGALVVPQTMGQTLHVLRLHAPDGADTRWHTDGAGWARQNDFTCLLCIKPAQEGGATELLPWAVLRSALARDPDLWRRLWGTDVPWILDDESGAGTAFTPIVTSEGLRYLREQIESAAAAFPHLAHDLHDLDDSLHQALLSTTGHLALRLTEGKVLVFDNRRSLHRRGPLPEGNAGERTLVRTRLTNPTWSRNLNDLD